MRDNRAMDPGGLEDLQTEIERLRAERDEACKMLLEAAPDVKEGTSLLLQQQAEIKRLRDERDELFLENGKLANELGAECLWLRTALRKIAKLGWNGDDKNDFCHPEGCESPGIARAALERK